VAFCSFEQQLAWPLHQVRSSGLVMAGAQTGPALAAEPPGAGRLSRPPQITPLDPTESKIDALQAELEQSVRYHQRRGWFYGRLRNITIVALVVLGWTAFDALAGNATAVFGFCLALLIAPGLVLYCSRRGEDHENLLRRYERLASELRTEEQTPAHLAGWFRQQRRIAASERRTDRAMNAACCSDFLQARDRHQYNIRLPPRLLMNFGKFDLDRFCKRASRK
jgi:hypothetical protein